MHPSLARHPTGGTLETASKSLPTLPAGMHEPVILDGCKQRIEWLDLQGDLGVAACHPSFLYNFRRVAGASRIVPNVLNRSCLFYRQSM
jgi:hypothetical protein